MRKYYTEQPDGSSIPADKDEVRKAFQLRRKRKNLERRIKKLSERLSQIQKGCTHLVTYDEQGYTYVHRNCVTCGHISLV